MEPKKTVSLIHNKARTIVANSTPEQEERLKGFKFGDRAPELWDMGFIVPNQVTSYYCKKCNKTYEDTPKVMASVRDIGHQEELTTSVIYICSHCDESIYLGYLPSPEGIPEEFIQFDETGDYRRPTVDSVNSLIGRIRNQAKEGQGSSIERPSYSSDLETAKRWAEKIGYDIRTPLGDLTTLFRTSYVARLERELPALVAEIKDKAYGFSLTEVDNVSNYVGIGLPDMMHQLRETIKLTTPSNPDINKDIVRIFDLYLKMGHEEKERLVAEKKDLEERIAQEEEFLVNARRQQSDFIRKVNLLNEQVDEARKSPLDTWPLKDDQSF